jgi:hypothetical protein
VPPDQFIQQLRSFLYKRPFEPFVVELIEGDPVLIEDPEGVAIGGTSAAYGTPFELYFLEHHNVRAVRPAAREATP